MEGEEEEQEDEDLNVISDDSYDIQGSFGGPDSNSEYGESEDDEDIDDAEVEEDYYDEDDIVDEGSEEEPSDVDQDLPVLRAGLDDSFIDDREQPNQDDESIVDDAEHYNISSGSDDDIVDEGDEDGFQSDDDVHDQFDYDDDQDDYDQENQFSEYEDESSIDGQNFQFANNNENIQLGGAIGLSPEISLNQFNDRAFRQFGDNINNDLDIFSHLNIRANNHKRKP